MYVHLDKYSSKHVYGYVYQCKQIYHPAKLQTCSFRRYICMCVLYMQASTQALIWLAVTVYFKCFSRARSVQMYLESSAAVTDMLHEFRFLFITSLFYVSEKTKKKL